MLATLSTTGTWALQNQCPPVVPGKSHNRNRRACVQCFAHAFDVFFGFVNWYDVVKCGIHFATNIRQKAHPLIVWLQTAREESDSMFFFFEKKMCPPLFLKKLARPNVLFLQFTQQRICWRCKINVKVDRT